MAKRKKADASTQATALSIHRQLLQIATAEIAKLPEHLEQLQPADRVRFVLAILPYTAPKMEKCATDFSIYGGFWGE